MYARVEVCKVYFSAGILTAGKVALNCLCFRFNRRRRRWRRTATDVTLHSHHTERWLVPLLVILVPLISVVVLIRIWF